MERECILLYYVLMKHFSWVGYFDQEYLVRVYSGEKSFLLYNTVFIFFMNCFCSDKMKAFVPKLCSHPCMSTATLALLFVYELSFAKCSYLAFQHVHANVNYD